jgi:hypothetical protein
MPFMLRVQDRVHAHAADNSRTVRDSPAAGLRRWGILMVVVIACLTTYPPRKASVAGEAKSDGRGCKKYHSTDDPSHGLTLRMACYRSAKGTAWPLDAELVRARAAETPGRRGPIARLCSTGIAANRSLEPRNRGAIGLTDRINGVRVAIRICRDPVRRLGVSDQVEPRMISSTGRMTPEGSSPSMRRSSWLVSWPA